MKLNNAITDVRGIEVGHAQDEEALTGCTVILCRKGAVAGVDVRGGAPGTRETDLLNPVNLVEKVHGIVLAGGSAFGLDAATGVMRYLEEKKIGFNTGVAKVPIVPSAILYDLNFGRADLRPDSAMGARAAASAVSDPPAEGNVGAGTGASVGKLFGMTLAMKSGLGTASMDIGGGVIVGAIVAVNAFGDVVDPKKGEIVAGDAMPYHALLGVADILVSPLLEPLLSILQKTIQHVFCRLRLGEFILYIHAQPITLNHASLTKQHEMLRDICLALARSADQVAHARGSLRQDVQNLQAHGMRHGM